MLTYYYVLDGQLVELKIDLANSDVVNLWKDCIKRVLSEVPDIFWLTYRSSDSYEHLHRYNLNSHRDIIIRSLYSLLSSFSYFQAHGDCVDNYSNEIDRLNYLIHQDWSDLNQNDLNIWHRHFTKLAVLFQHDQFDKEELWGKIHDVNRYVHQCEILTYTKIEKRKKFNKSATYSISHYNAHLDVDNEYRKINKICCSYDLSEYSFDIFKDNSDYTVWLNEDILGKDQIKSWLDGDDLCAGDCTGNLQLTINIMLDPGKIFYRVINDPEFRLASAKSNKKLNRFPLGNMIDPEKIDFEAIRDRGDLVGIELDNSFLCGNPSLINRLKDKNI